MADAGVGLQVRCRLRGEAAPFPVRFRRGHLARTGEAVSWRSLVGRGPEITLGPMRVVRVDRQGAKRRTAREVVVHARDGAGVEVDFVVQSGLLGRVHAWLERSGVGAGSTRAQPFERVGLDRVRAVMPTWTAALGLLGVLWIATWAWFFVGGTRLPASVLEVVSDGCLVAWSIGDTPQKAVVDCGADTKPGDRVAILALPAPLEHEAVDTSFTPGAVAGTAAVLFAAPALAAFLYRRWDAEDEARSSVSPVARREALPILSATDLSFPTAAEATGRRARAEGWPERPADGVAQPAEWSEASARRRLARRALAGSMMPLLVVAFAAIIGAPWWANVRSYGTGGTEMVVAEVVDFEPAWLLFAPNVVTVGYTIGDHPIEADLLTRRAFAPADVVTVWYSVGDPRMARLGEGADATVFGAAVTGGLAALGGLAWVGWLVRAQRRMRSIGRARRAPGEPARYVLYLGAKGEVHALLYAGAGDGPPTSTVQLIEDVRGAVPPSGFATAHSLTGGLSGWVVPVVAGTPLWPARPARPIEAEEAAQLLNGETIDWRDSSDESDGSGGEAVHGAEDRLE